MEEKKMTFASRMKSFFGYREGHDNLKEFGEELKSLTMADKLEFYEAFNEQGMPTDPPMTPRI